VAHVVAVWAGGESGRTSIASVPPVGCSPEKSAVTKSKITRPSSVNVGEKLRAAEVVDRGRRAAVAGHRAVRERVDPDAILATVPADAAAVLVLVGRPANATVDPFGSTSGPWRR
jgi:hypothetical protein